MNLTGNNNKIGIFIPMLVLFIFGIGASSSQSALFTPFVFAVPHHHVISMSNISTNSTVVHVGSSIGIHAIVLNKSSESIKFSTGCGAAPLTATFDNNVKTDKIPHCFEKNLVILKSGEQATLKSPPAAEKYIASSPGKTLAHVTFHYDGGSVTGKLVFNIVK